MTRPLTLAGCLVALVTAAPVARQDQPPGDRPRFGTSTAAVVVDVIVRDRRGSPVVDLTRDDFEVFENGTPQRVIDFERVLPAAVTPAADATATSHAASAQAVDAAHDEVGEDVTTLRGQAVTAIVFDWLSEQSRYEAWKAASTLLGQMNRDDYAAVFVIDQALRRIVPFTSDTAPLKVAFDYALTRTRPSSSRLRSAAADALVTRSDVPLTPGAEEGAPGLVAPSGVPTQGPGAELARMLQRMDAWEGYMNRQQQGISVSRGLLGLVEQMSALPGRKTVVLFSEGLEIPENIRHTMDLVEERANVHNVSFYTVDAAGLRVHSRLALARAAIGEAGREDFSEGIANDSMGRRTEALWRDPSAGLEPLAQRTGGLYIGGTNALAEGFARINADRRFHYLLAYSSTNPRLDGSYRKIHVRVRRADVKVRARGGYVASPSIERTDRRGYEAPALAALAGSPSPSAFPFQSRAVSTPIEGQPGMTSLVAAVDTRMMTFTENPSRRTYDGEVTVLARIVSKSGEALATQSQLYTMHGDLSKLDEVKQGRLLFFRTPDVPPGAHTVEWVVRDGASGDASVLRSPVSVPLPELRPVVGDLLVVDHAEKAPADDPAMKRHPLVWNGMLLYPSLGLPVSKAARRELMFFLPMIVDRGEPPPSTTIELLRGGRSLGTIDVPAGASKGDSLRRVGTMPIDKLPPGVYELRATVTAGDRTVSRTAVFTLVQ
jgi:VWFA-related protein